jgi:hypothetical protein
MARSAAKISPPGLDAELLALIQATAEVDSSTPTTSLQIDGRRTNWLLIS